jgi:hypothetical protein
MVSVYSIHHSARCGSTLLVSLLSSIAPAYAEPGWCRQYWEDGADIPESRDGAIVKLPSFALFHHILPGPQIFLYRPLAQHLLKYKGLPANWLAPRLNRIGDCIDVSGLSGTTQVFAAFWAKQIALAIDIDALFIKSNSLFSEPETVANSALRHFGLNGQPDLRFLDYDVKAARLIGQNDPISFGSFRSVPLRSKSDYGVCTTEDALADPLIKATVEWAEMEFPQCRPFTR